MFTAVLALGSNLGDREKNISSALSALGGMGRLMAVSRLYENPAQGPGGQGDYLNAAAAIDTDLQPSELLERCMATEASLGRTRPFRDAPRTIDIDIIFFGDLSMKTESLEIPHPRWRGRDFVITPLLDLRDAGVFSAPEFEMLRLFLSVQSRKYEPFHAGLK